MRARWLMVAFLLVAGCALEQQELEKEREKLVVEKQVLEEKLQGRPLDNQRETKKLLQSYSTADGRIREIDRQLRKW